MTEVLTGIHDWLYRLSERNLLMVPQEKLDFTIGLYKQIFYKIRDSFGFPDSNRAMVVEHQESPDYNLEINLGNPYSKASCLILLLYSLELGSPPLHSVLNRTVCLAKTEVVNDFMNHSQSAVWAGLNRSRNGGIGGRNS